ncbi:MAG: DUF1826 domain-containing protein [Rhodobacteraceae bacterium]|nr:DUF1826 domain-containing protein [Paracoccaceae bacterium]
MALTRIEAKTACPGVTLTKTPEGLGALYRPGCAAAVWERAPLQRFQNWIDAIPASQLPKTRTILQPGAVRRAMHELCSASGLSDCEERAMLVDDVAALADIFADLMQAPYLRLRLDVVTTNACRKFHIDTVTARLVCTYRGTGTQYGIATDGGAVDTIQTVGTGAPILLRGALWPVTPDFGLLHRSPPIEGTKETRLVLVLDPITELENSASPYLVQ